MDLRPWFLYIVSSCIFGKKGREDAFGCSLIEYVEGRKCLSLDSEVATCNLNVGCWVAIIFTRDLSTARDVSEDLTPTALVVQIFLKIVVVVVGIEYELFIRVDNVIMILIVSSVNYSRRTASDGLSVIVYPCNVRGIAVGTGGSDVYFIIIEVSSTTAYARKRGLVRIFGCASGE